ncbi:hypothetical protein D3C80_1801890 [compost metagenome]
MLAYQVPLQTHRHAVLVEQRDIGKAQAGLLLVRSGGLLGMATVVMAAVGQGQGAGQGQAQGKQLASRLGVHRTLLESSGDDSPWAAFEAAAGKTRRLV